MKSATTLSHFRNRSGQVRGRVTLVVVLVVIYGIASSLFLSHRVYEPVGGSLLYVSNDVTSSNDGSSGRNEDDIFSRALRGILRLSSKDRRLVTKTKPSKGSQFVDPITAVLMSALTSIGSSATSSSTDGSEYDLDNHVNLDNLDNHDNDEEDALDGSSSDTQLSEREIYYRTFNDGLPVGVLSRETQQFFRDIQREMDNADNKARCERYNGYYNASHPANRKIFYGALAASEPWELYEIVAAEVYGLYAGMVFVEGNRTQNFTPRSFQRLNHANTFKQLFGSQKVQVRQFVNEDSRLQSLHREHAQRAEILKGWQELGMQPEDVGLLADSDETFTRDFLKAVQVCDGIEILDYDKHHCHHSKVKLTATTRVFESSPECITIDRQWFHPDLIIGHCIEGISKKPLHKPAIRANELYSFMRAKGHGGECLDWEIEDRFPNQSYSLWNAADFRRACGGYMVNVRPRYRTYDDGSTLDLYTGYHFHNFFAQFKSTRFKYLTYGHSDPNANLLSIPDMSNDLKMMYKCVKELEDSADQKWKRVKGGYDAIKPFLPIYFHDPDYRDRRHKHLQQMVYEDEQILHEHMMQQQLKLEKEQEQVQNPQVSVDQSGNEISSTRLTSETGIDISDPLLFLGDDSYNGNSTAATVIALATNYDLRTYQRFVGSLRKSGYKGHIILGLHPDVDNTILEYMKFRNVIVKKLSWTNCTYTKSPNEKRDIFKKTTCAHPYPDIKIRWSRFPLARDWLMECTSCTGPVLVMDARDAIFQADPFGPGSPPVFGLQVFQEHVNMTTSNWLTDWPIKDCKGIQYKNKPMLCSGTTVGTRAAMLKYLDLMYSEMKVWIEDPKCRFDINGDDQSIHNYLFYSGQLPFATSIVNRMGGIVNTIGHHAAQVAKRRWAQLKEKRNMSYAEARRLPYEGADGRNWIGKDFGLTNDDGMFIEFDGSLSRVVHQWDRFDLPFEKWLNKQDWAKDDIEFVNYMKTNRNSQSSRSLTSSEQKSTTSLENAVFSISKKDSTSSLGKRRMTDTGIDLTNSELYETVDLKGDSTTATVIALASGYGLDTYERFVGSLRKSGFKGHIILGVSPNVSPVILRYFQYRNVTAKILKWVSCTYMKGPEDKGDIFKQTTCSHPYPDIKIRWSRFPLARDWLNDCTTCTGPVLIMDARDSLFQLDPFGIGSPPVTGLQVFQEHVNMTTTNWLTDGPIGRCKNAHYDAPMLCSGTTVGTRAAMLKYLDIMYAEMRVWIEDPKCRFDINGDDQSIHNYLYYSGQLPFAESIVNRMGGIVNTIGHHAAQIAKQHFAKYPTLPKWEAAKIPYDGATDKTWIGTKEYGVTNDQGQFIEFDGSLSRVVHQWDRFHQMYLTWLHKQPFIKDPVPADWNALTSTQR